MNSFVNLIILAGIASIASAQSLVDPRCKKNEAYTDCGSSCSELTCDKQSLANILCPAVCESGCFCAPGFVRSAAGNCIRPKNCPRKCKVNQVYTDCGSGCGDLTCEMQSYEVCPDVCIPGCFCAPGFVRNDEEVCIKPKNCPQNKCGRNEEYSTCGTACELSCANPIPGICIAMCVEGCFCKEGYIRNAKGFCILIKNCPKK